MNLLNKRLLAVAITLPTASICFSQQVKDTMKSKDIEQVVLTGVTDIAKDRKTPVAVSTIKEGQIVERLGNQEFPEILSATPSVYVTKSGGGFGDSRITIRGFDQNNIAVLINGVPVNDMENGAVYWSNWAGLSDVTSALQVQRGLGSSKLAIASVGGTVNVLTRSADKKRGAKVELGLGNDGYHKALFSYNTGKSTNGWSSSFLLSRTAGNTYADGTQFEGYNYYFALGFQPSFQHDFQFTLTGAPQWHNQRSYSVKISDAQKYGGTFDKPNRRYNINWGYLDGEEFTMTRNYYHKPVMSLNWDWKMSGTSKLSTVLYGSWGRGGGTGDAGRVANPTAAKSAGVYDDSWRTSDGLINFDAIYAANQLSTSDKGIIIRRASVNSHNWYGILSNFQQKINQNWNFSVGIDARYYKGFHYRVVNNLLGGTAYKDTSNKNNPPSYVSTTYDATPSWNPFGGKVEPVENRIIYANDSQVNWFGGFGQLEYTNEKLSAFVQASVSNQGFKRIDNFIVDGVDGIPATTPTKNLVGYNLKSGANYNIDDYNNVFANIGYYQRQPYFGAVFLNNKNILNPNLTNEKVFSIELGYGYRSESFDANLNLYRTNYNDQFTRLSYRDATTNQLYYANLLGVNEVHQGVELDINYKPIQKLSLNAMLSIGDYHYTGEPTATFIDDSTNQTVSTSTLYLNNVKVGNKAQTTASLGATYEPVDALKIYASYKLASRNYSSFDPSTMTKVDAQPAIKLPNFGLVDLGASYKIKLNNPIQFFTIQGNVYNLFNKYYITDSYTNIAPSADPSQNWNGVNVENAVYFGFGTTWAASVSFNF